MREADSFYSAFKYECCLIISITENVSVATNKMDCLVGNFDHWTNNA